MAVQYTQFYDQMQSLVDSINHDSDPASRLRNVHQMHKDASSLLLRCRDEAAYDLRAAYSSEDAERMTGVSAKYVNYWATQWREKNSLPPLKRKRTADLSQALNLSGKASLPASAEG